MKEANAAVSNMKESDDPNDRHERFREIAARQAAPIKVTVDKDTGTGILHDVLFLGTRKAGRGRLNGVYSADVIQRDIGKYEGAPTYVGHAKDGANPDYNNKLGVHRNVRATPEGGRSDFHFNLDQPSASQLLWDAAHDPAHVGFSPDHDCTFTSDNHGRRIVKSIDEVFSLDLVTRPATTHGLAEEEGDDEPIEQSILQEDEPMAIDWKEVTEESLKANCPDLVAKLQGTDEHTRLTEEVTTLKTTVSAKDAALASKETELVTLRANEAKRLREQEIATELTAAKFPTGDAVIYSASFKEQLTAAPDKTARATLITDRLALAKARLQEQDSFPAPLAQLTDTASVAGSVDHSFDNLFGVAK